MICVRNKLDKVLVLKSTKALALRLLPGHNMVDAKDLSVYTKGNPAAQAMVDENLTILDSKQLKAEEKAAAENAKTANDSLNKSAVLLKAAQDKLVKAEERAKTDGSAMESMKGEIAELKAQLAQLLKKIPAVKEDKK